MCLLLTEWPFQNTTKPNIFLYWKLTSLTQLIRIIIMHVTNQMFPFLFWFSKFGFKWLPISLFRFPLTIGDVKLRVTRIRSFSLINLFWYSILEAFPLFYCFFVCLFFSLFCLHQNNCHQIWKVWLFYGSATIYTFICIFYHLAFSVISLLPSWGFTLNS